MISAVAGTFDVVHSGHGRLLDRAFEIGDEVLVGLTSDRMAAQGRNEYIPFAIRRPALEKKLATYGKPYTLFQIDDIYGPSDIMDAADALVVSEETVGNADALNRERESRGIRPLKLSVVELVTASDGEKISARRILEGRYGRNGKTDVLDVSVGSMNRVKVEAVRNVMERIYGDVRITPVKVPSGVPDQPFEDETEQGAENRARAALGDHDLSVGIEAGVFEQHDGLYDIQKCCIIDSDGRTSRGQGSGFRYPDEVADLVRSGHTVGDAFRALYGKSEIGKNGGAIGMLSNGLLDRESLTEQAVMAAMIPRIWGSRDV